MENTFQDGGHLGFSIKIILAIFDLQVTLMLSIKFKVNWARGVGFLNNNKQQITDTDLSQ